MTEVPNARERYIKERKQAAGYVSKLLGRIPLTKVEIAARIGTTDRTLRAYESQDYAVPYTVQFALERLAESFKKPPKRGLVKGRLAA